MNTLAILTAAGAAHLLAVASPGPDFVIVSRQTLAHGRRAGLMTAWGIACGVIVHLGYALFGLGWLLQHQPLLLEALRYAGAGFLLWMGLKALRAPAITPTSPPPDGRNASPRDFWIGLGTNLLNPKAALFFVALCAALVTTDASLAPKLALAIWIFITTGAWFSLVAISLGHRAVRQRLLHLGHWIDRGMGALLLLLAAAMLLAR